MTEFVAHPRHYNNDKSGVECIDLIEILDYSLSSAVKYCWRVGLKPNESEQRELQKAMWLLNRASTRLPTPTNYPDSFFELVDHVIANTDSVVLQTVLKYVAVALLNKDDVGVYQSELGLAAAYLDYVLDEYTRVVV